MIERSDDESVMAVDDIDDPAHDGDNDIEHRGEHDGGASGEADDEAPDAPEAPATESLTFTISLPLPVRETPEDEVAVSITDVAISPSYADVSVPLTTTILIPSVELAVMPADEDADEVVIPSLPEPDDVYTRRARQRGEVSAGPEPATMLTAERLVVKSPGRSAQAPEGAWRRFVWRASFGLVNPGDSWAVRQRKSLDARIARQLDGRTRFVAVLTRKGGVGKTTVSALLGMALADVRDDRIIAIDANPDRGTLAERITRNTRATVRDVITRARSVSTFSEFQTLISRDETRMDVLASDADPTVSEAFDEDDYNVVADTAERFYTIAVTDCGTGMLHSAMSATLQRADSIIVVSGGSVDEARLASETLTWLESNGYPELVRNGVVALNTATHGTNLVKLDEIEAHFTSRVRAVARIPYDPTLATGSVIRYHRLSPNTRAAARQMAATVVDGLPTRREP